MISTKADMANPYLNVSRQSKPNISSKSYTKEFVVITPGHAPWLPEFSKSDTSGRPFTIHHSPYHVRKCKPCQKHGNLIHQKQEQLHHILSPWPFAKWGMDILDPFSPGKGQVKFLIVAVDYFTKWIEAKPLTTITSQQVQQFVWKDIIFRYGVPHTIITNNGRQFIDKELAKFYTGLGIKHITSSVEHPQTNEHAEAANKVILVELRKRLDTVKGRWPKELIEVLWAYRCTPNHQQTNPHSA